MPWRRISSHEKQERDTIIEVKHIPLLLISVAACSWKNPEKVSSCRTISKSSGHIQNARHQMEVWWHSTRPKHIQGFFAHVSKVVWIGSSLITFIEDYQTINVLYRSVGHFQYQKCLHRENPLLPNTSVNVWASILPHMNQNPKW